MSPESLQSFLSLATGFAVAGLVSSAYQLYALRPASFRLLGEGPRGARIAAVPMLVFAAPFIIMRSAVGARADQRRRFEFAMLTTIIAGCWSLLSGTAILTAVSAIERLLA
jgi:hypothetical protein